MTPEPPPRWMTDDEQAALEAALADPFRISTVQEAEMVLEVLDAELAEITTRLEEYQARAAQQSPPEHLEQWASRASYGVFRRKVQHKLVKSRLRQLRTHENLHNALARVDSFSPNSFVSQAARREWIERQIAEAERAARQIARSEAVFFARVQAQYAALNGNQHRMVNRLFVEVARENLPPEEFSTLWEAARTRFQQIMKPLPPEEE